MNENKERKRIYQDGRPHFIRVTAVKNFYEEYTSAIKRS